MLTGLPKEPVMLLSVVNSKLRDYYTSLGELCEDMDVDESALSERLSAIGYIYNKKENQFL